MRMTKWLAAMAALCLMLLCVPARAEEAQVGEVDTSVEEVELALGGLEPEALPGDDAAAPEIIPDEPEPTPAPTPFVPPYPDVTSAEIRRQVVPSARVYPSALIWPLPGQEPLTHLTSHVGWRNAARISHSGGTWASWLHHGVDVGGVDTSQPVVAADGGLAYAGERAGLGKYVVIDHENGWYTRYQHLSAYGGELYPQAKAIPLNAGSIIGYVGNSGGNYAVHLHFEIAWSPDGPGADDETYQNQTQSRRIRAWSYPQQQVVVLHWPKTWELCSAENMFFVSLALEDVLPVEPEETPEP